MHSAVRLVGLVLALSALSVPAAAQRLEPPTAGSVGELDQILRRLGHEKRVLVIGAHPDDEDTELLTVLTRGEGAEAAYLSLTRGEGGQNLIGPELGDPLGLLRTEELLAARGLDGARQFFTRAYDFGFSKNLDDTWRHWQRDSVLKDVVRIVRRYRPQVIVSIFSGTPRDGHGQHQAAGWAAHEAFEAAADAARFPELSREEGLAPWAPVKLYRSARFDTAATTLTLEGGVVDPADGRSFHQIAMASRSLHSSQDMGQLQRIGPSRVRIALVADRSGSGTGALWAGVDTTAARSSRYAALVDSARSLLTPAALDDVGRLLREARAELVRELRAGPAPGRPSAPPSGQLEWIDRALAMTGRVVVDAVADDERIAAGEPVGVTLIAWNASEDTVRVTPVLAPSWGGTAATAATASSGAGLDARTVAPGDTAVWRTAVPVPPGMQPTAPYFVRDPDAAVYRLAEGTPPGVRGLPFGPPPLTAMFTIANGETAYSAVREVAYRYNDQAVGEVRRPLTVVAPLEVRIDPGSTVWRVADTAPRTVRVTVVNRTGTGANGRVRLAVPDGWAAPAPAPFTLDAEDESAAVSFTVRRPARLAAGDYTVSAVAELEGGLRSGGALATVEYPHIRPRTYGVPAELRITAADIALPAVERIAYVRGAADRVPEALRAVGLPVEVLDGRALGRADLSRYDAVVIGPRAYEVDAALLQQNRRLLDYARGGGLVIVQYQQYAFFEGGYAPYRLEAAGARTGPIPANAGPDTARPAFRGHDRVTDEASAVTVLVPEHPALVGPNRIGPADWEGWVQERGLYFARAWDDRYTPLLEMRDPGERAMRGALLVAPVGEGTWVYTGLSFFRQLPAGVPGAYRLFANLLGLAGSAGQGGS